MTRLRIMSLLAASACLAGCASIGPPVPPSLELPRPPTDLRAVRKGDKVSLTWTIPTQTMQRQAVRYLGRTDICRSIVRPASGQGAGYAAKKPAASSGKDRAVSAVGQEPCELVVGNVASLAISSNGGKTASQKQAASFTDVIPKSEQALDPNGSAVYAVEVLNEDNRGAGFSNSASVSLVPTLAPFASFAAQLNARGVQLTWVCPGGSGASVGVNYRFRIYRRPVASGPDLRIAELDANKCAGISGGAPTDTRETPLAEAGTSFLDDTIEWEKSYLYRGTVVSVLAPAGKSQAVVEGDDTPEVKVFAHDVFPPAVPTALQAVYSGPGTQSFIDLVWAPVGDADLAGYNIYRREEGSGVSKLNAAPVQTPAYRDAQVRTGVTYMYSVSAVDERGNESGRSPEASETVP